MFINGQQYKKLREAAKNGDEKATLILKKQYQNGDEDISSLIEEYFNPQPIQEEPVVEEKATEPNKLERFLIDNDVHEGDEDYNDVVKMFYQENPQEIGSFEEGIDSLIEDELEAIQGYDKGILMLLASSDINEAKKKGFLTIFQSIKEDEMEHIEKLKKIKEDFSKKVEKEQEIL